MRHLPALNLRQNLIVQALFKEKLVHNYIKQIQKLSQCDPNQVGRWGNGEVAVGRWRGEMLHRDLLVKASEITKIHTECPREGGHVNGQSRLPLLGS